MTYASDRRGAGGVSKSSSANGQQRLPLGPRNSLDYWNKSEDWQGVTTYYWNKGGNSPYGMENVYAQTPARRPAPFPLNLPVSKPGSSPAATSPRGPPSSTQNSGYQNIPIPRVKMPETRSNARITPPKDSPIFPARQGPESLIWSVSSHHHNNHVAPMTTNAPQISRVAVSPAHAARLANEKCHRAPRQKPRWGRFMRTLCCCVVQQQPTEKPTTTHPAPSSPSLLITQVQKNGGSYNDVPHYTRTPLPSNEGKKNEYSPAPTVVPAQQRQPSPTEKFLTNGERPLLPQLRPADTHKKCLIIDLDETLVHSSFKPVKNADFVIPVEIDGVEHKVYVLKRPYVDEFLERVGERFECVLFTASLAKYADPVADLLDKRGVFRARLFREACVYHKGNYVKDLARLGRELHKVVIIDNSPASYAFHPENALPVQTWFDDPTDCELLEILPLLERMERIESVYHATHRDDSPSDVLLDRSSS